MSDNGTALVVRPVQQATLIRPVAQIAEMVEVEKIYQDAITQILDDSDYQSFDEGYGEKKTTKKFRKKSGWRKLQRFFGLSTEAGRTEERFIDCNPAMCVSDCPGFHYEVVAYYRAIAPNGQYEEGEASCIDNEDAPDPREVLRRRAEWRNAENYLPNRKNRHDVLSTAGTRAYNRAVSNLIGAGEVSAEEINRKKTTHEDGDEDPAAKRAAERAAADAAAAEQKEFARRVKEATREIYELLGIDAKAKDPAVHASAMKAVADASGIAVPEKWREFGPEALEKFIEYKKKLAAGETVVPPSHEAKPEDDDVIDAEFTENPPAEAQTRKIDDVATLSASDAYVKIEAIVAAESMDDENAHLQELTATASQADGAGVIYAWRRLKAAGLKRLLELLELEKDEIPL